MADTPPPKRACVEQTRVVLSAQQQAVIESICGSGGKNALVCGAAGTGKSALIKELVRRLHENGVSVLVCAPTWRAALNVELPPNVPSGTSINKAFGFKTELPDPVEHAHKLRSKGDTYAALADPACLTVICDEMSMVTSAVAAFMTEVLDVIRSNRRKQPAQLVMVGDIAQLPPVNGECFVHSQELFRRLFEPSHVHLLQTQFRQRSDPEFASILTRISDGSFSVQDLAALNKWCLSPGPHPDALRLFGLRTEASAANRQRLLELERPIHEYEYKFVRQPTYSKMSFMEPVLRDQLRDSVFRTAIGAPVMLIMSPDPERGWVTSTMATVIGFTPIPSNPKVAYPVICRLPNIADRIASADATAVRKTCRIVSGIEKWSRDPPVFGGDWNDYFHATPRDCFKFEKSKTSSCALVGVPLAAAFAVTYHTAQGITSKVSVTPAPRSMPGAIYVALSRAPNRASLKLQCSLTPESISTDPRVKAFVAYCQSLPHNAQYH